MPRPRLLALDLDGTLLGPDGRVSPRNVEAVAAAEAAGVQVVVCTGRRFRTSAWILEELGLEGPAVVHNGVLTKSGATGETLASHYLASDVYAHALGMMRSFAPPIVYVDRYHEGLDMLVEPADRSHAYQASYLADYVAEQRVVDSLDDTPGHDVIMMSLMAGEEELATLRLHLDAHLGEEAHTNFLMNKNYSGCILEVTSSRASKWTALHELAKASGIEDHEIMAIGDDRNDLAMIAGAGLGIAMANAVDAVKAVAAATTSGNDEDGVARAIERHLL
jgi:Cof subfamily protein (haloacid dehalogenase superfamily)